jgi:predicted transcriptional regulator of viral defense system
MTLATTYRRQLHERALDQYGYVTTRDADELDVPAWAVRQIAARGGLTKRGHGVYRFDDVPVTGRDEFMEAVLAVGDGAHLVGDAVLALHGLADVNPARIRIGTPKRARRRLPRTIVVMPRHDQHDELTTYEGIPTTTVARAIRDARGAVMRDRLIAAAREAGARGLLRRREVDEVLTELGAGATGPT